MGKACSCEMNGIFSSSSDADMLLEMLEKVLNKNMYSNLYIFTK